MNPRSALTLSTVLLICLTILQHVFACPYLRNKDTDPNFNSIASGLPESNYHRRLQQQKPPPPPPSNPLPPFHRPDLRHLPLQVRQLYVNPHLKQHLLLLARVLLRPLRALSRLHPHLHQAPYLSDMSLLSVKRLMVPLLLSVKSTHALLTRRYLRASSRFCPEEMRLHSHTSLEGQFASHFTMLVRSM